MLVFTSLADYDLFIKSIDLMEDLWRYSDVDYEDTPLEIYHLGEESLNAWDSAMNFQSLRYKYELNEFYNYDWADTASLYVDDDYYPIVLNQNSEFKIGAKYYKFIFNDIIAIVDNNNFGALELVRQRSIFARNPDIQFFSEELSRLMDPEETGGSGGAGGTLGCNNFEIYGFAKNITPPLPGTTQWTVRLLFSGFFNIGTTSILPCVLADWQINWGDGTIETFTDRFQNPTIRFHTYSQSIPQGGAVTKNISITCRIIDPCTDPLISFNCPTITSLVFNANTSVILAIPPPPDNCLDKNIKRKFYGAQLSVGGKTYRLHCKLKQKPNSPIGPHVTTTVIFEKQKANGRWKKTKPVFSMDLKLRGKIYNEETCNNVYHTMNHSKSTTHQKKLKIREYNVTLNFRSRRNLPEAINADFIWYYNNGQTAVGAYNQVLKP